MKTKYYIIVFAFIFIKLKAQITYGGEPYTSLVNTTNTTLASYISLSPTIASYSLPAYDNTTLKMRSDSIVNSCTQCGKKLYGTGVEQTIDLMSQGTYQLIGNTKVYRFLVHSDNALGLQFYFSKFKLPESGSLFFYPPDKSYMYGALTQFSNWKDTLRDDSSKIAMATVPLLGNEWVLEYNEDVSAEFSAQIEISIIVHGYDGQVLSRIAEGPVNCQVDVACEEANYDIECEKESTLMMLFLDNGGAHSHWAGYCTGNLINTANDSEIPYVMTAGHCFNDANNQAMLYDPHGLIFVFKYEGDNCENDGSSEPYDQRYSTFGGGPIVVKNLQASYDYALVKLTGISKEILSDWGVCYAGWDNRTTLSAAPPYVLIHHAEGKEKKISITPASEQLESVTYITDATTVSTAGFYRSHWDVGVPEFGSGGASLFDQNHRIIATYNGYDPVAQTAA
ncbi:MAG: trypsin-like serine peptidase, partial [Bacteroidia bacterium]